MSFIIVVYSNLELRVLQLANIHASSVSVPLQEVDKGGQVVRKILRLFKRGKKVFLMLLLRFLKLLSLIMLTLQ
jgi:hypothetical protein